MEGNLIPEISAPVSDQLLNSFPRFDCRVNALDAQRIGGELLDLLRSQISSCWSLLSPTLVPDPELTLFLRLLIFFSSTYRHQPTPSDAMLNVKLSNDFMSAPSSIDDDASNTTIFLSNLLLRISYQNMTATQKWGYAILVIVCPWVITRLKITAERYSRDYHSRKQQLQLCRALRLKGQQSNNKDNNKESDNSMPVMAKLYLPLCYISTIYDLASLVNMIVFLVNGSYRSIEERILGLEVKSITPDTKRQVDCSYLRHQMYWNSITELLLAVIPGLEIESWIGLIRGLCRWIVHLTKRKWKQISKGKNFNPEYGEDLIPRFKNQLVLCLKILSELSVLLLNGENVELVEDGFKAIATSRANRLCTPEEKKQLMTQMDESTTKNDTQNKPGECLYNWFNNPFNTSCGLCGITPINLPTIGNCHCSLPFCYLCIYLKCMNNATVICPHCGGFITTVNQINPNTLRTLNENNLRN